MGGRQVVRPRTLDPVSKVRILPAQPVSNQLDWQRLVVICFLERRSFRGDSAQRFWIIARVEQVGGGFNVTTATSRFKKRV
jgi:hypothetical protein